MTAVTVNPYSRLAWPPALARTATLDTHVALVERIVAVMRERLNEQWTLDEISRLAHLSPYHFCRIFRRITGVPPFKFLAALRMAEAKRLLLTTDMSVTDICLQLGYRSLGTFTTHFTEMVGIPPRGLRRLSALIDETPFESLVALAVAHPDDPESVHVPLEVRVLPGWGGPIFVGAFTSRLPRGIPVACRLVGSPGDWLLPCSSPGALRIFAATLARTDDPLDYLLPDPDNLLVAQADVIAVESCMPPTRLDLRVCGPLDPPIVIALPYLLWQSALEHAQAPAA
jgi:AraC family transcriptional regulator